MYIAIYNELERAICSLLCSKNRDRDVLPDLPDFQDVIYLFANYSVHERSWYDEGQTSPTTRFKYVPSLH